MSKLILLGIDGATWQIIGPLIKTGELRNFRKLVTEGRAGILQSTVPAESPPAWTSMFTGVNPGKHGIVDFYLNEGNRFVPCLTRYRMTQSIWRIMSDAGKKCIIINDPVAFPPEPVNGIMTTGLMTPPGSSNWIYPKNRKREVDTIARGYECDIPPNFVNILTEDREAALDVLRKLASKVFRVATYAAANLEWDVLAVIVTATDRLQHFWWNDKARISELYKRIDTTLGELIECANGKAEFIIVSDHGFGPCDRFVSLNGSLEKLGFLVRTESFPSKFLGRIGFSKDTVRSRMGAWPSAFTALPGFMQDMIRRYVPESGENVKELDTSKSVAFAKTTSGVFVREKELIESVTAKLSELTDETTGERIVEKIMYREQELQGEYSYRAPNLFLEPRVGYGFSIGRSSENIWTGTHRPQGIFLHWHEDGNTKETPLATVIRPWDVAASILHLANVPIPDYFDGRLIV